MMWQKAITGLIQEAKTIPLWGNVPAFPFGTFNEALKARFGLPDLHVESKRADWLPAGGWRQGSGTKPVVFALEAPSLQGQIYWVTSVEEMKELCNCFLLATGHELNKLQDAPLSFLKGFYRFVCLNVLDILAQIDAFPGLHFSFSDKESVPDEPMFAIEASVAAKGTKSFAKILLSQRTLGSFKNFFKREAPMVSMEEAANVKVTLPIVVGQTSLKPVSWKQLSVGDCLLLDHCAFKPKIKRGRVRIFLENQPIAVCILTNNTLEILEYQFHEEEIVKGESEHPEGEEEFSSEEESQEGEEFIEEDLGEGEFEELPEEEHLPESAEMAEIPPLTKEVPINLCVEIARLKMSLDQVLSLKPGNLIELLVTPEQGVTITANGKAVARGELLQFGEALGVKITELG